MSDYEKVVAEALETAKSTDDGKLSFAEDVPEHVQFAARTMKRHRDTQSAFTRGQQRIKALETENEGLVTSWEKDALSALSTTEQNRLNELKYQDPDKWRDELSAIEEQKKTEFAEKHNQIRSAASETSELARREEVLAKFHSDNPGFTLSDEDVPPRIANKLARGEVTFEEFLEESKEFLTKGRAIAKTDEPAKTPSLAGTRGSDTPSADAMAAKDAEDYSKILF